LLRVPLKCKSTKVADDDGDDNDDDDDDDDVRGNDEY
jgi:hypothetical protein